ncbi:hypothetical protein JCM16303_003614 [Sporobolomyces ruberrimus]
MVSPLGLVHANSKSRKPRHSPSVDTVTSARATAAVGVGSARSLDPSLRVFPFSRIKSPPPPSEPIRVFHCLHSAVLSLSSSVSATSKPCASQSIKPHHEVHSAPARHSHYSHPSLHLSLQELIKSRQAIAPPIFYATNQKKEKLSQSSKKWKSLGWELEGVRDEMGRLTSRVRKLGKRDVSTHDATGEEIHDLLFTMLDSIVSPPAIHSSRDLQVEEIYVTRPINNRAIAHPSASPIPSGRAKRSTLTQAQDILSVTDVERSLSRVLGSFSSILALAADTLPTIPSRTQRDSIEALLDELRWEMSTLLADTQHDVPDLSVSNDLF